MTTSSRERRRAPRVSAGMFLEQLESGESHQYYVSDLSESGLYMQRPVGAFVRHSKHVQLEIPLPDHEDAPLWAHAEVVYDCFDGGAHGTAVRFTDMAEHDRVRLHRWLATRRTCGDAVA